MEEPILEDQNLGTFQGVSIHFERLIKRWKIYNFVQIFFLFLQMLLIGCYYGEAQYQLNHRTPIALGIQGLFQILMYLNWRSKLCKIDNILQCAADLKELRFVDNDWNDAQDMHTYYRFDYYFANIKTILSYHIQFIHYMYKKYYFYFQILLISGIYTYIIWYSPQELYKYFGFVSSLTILSIILFLDIFSILILYPLCFGFHNFIQKLKRKKYIRPYRNSLLNRGILECPICLEEFHKGQVIYQLTCNHFYHEICIRSWGMIRQQCPLCRNQFNLIQ